MDTVSATKDVVVTLGVAALVIDDLTPEDLACIGWSGRARHIRAVADVLARVDEGETEYLAVRSPDGTPVAIGGIDYVEAPGLGTIYQLSTMAALQGLGLGTALIAAAEDRIRRRGLTVARVGVEDDNPRARALYERLGYRPSGRRRASWEAQRPDGSVYLYETEVTEFDKRLG